jgi:diadenosine tetraphosphate (Ap4A) HIT family hydrolase
VQLSLGPIVEGYTLIVSLDHISCCAEIPEQSVDEFDALVRAVSKAQRSVYGKSVFYEHGRTGSCAADPSGEPHCYHAHLHMVPTAIPVAEHVNRELALTRFDNWDDVRSEYSDRRKPYILVQDGSDIGVSFDPKALRRQFLRSIVANATGMPELSDWMAFPGSARIATGFEKLAAAIRDSVQAEGLQFGDRVK